jgi:hypothetical protein
MIGLLEAIEPDEFRVLSYMDCSGNQAANHLSVALGLDFERVWRALDRLAQRGLVSRSEEWVDSGNGEGRFELAGWRVKRDAQPPFQWGGSIELLEAIHPDEFVVFLYLEEHGFRPPTCWQTSWAWTLSASRPYLAAWLSAYLSSASTRVFLARMGNGSMNLQVGG